MPYENVAAVTVMQRVAHENLRLALSAPSPLAPLLAACCAENPKDRFFFLSFFLLCLVCVQTCFLRPSFDDIERSLRSMTVKE
jgi:hypothetical protein